MTVEISSMDFRVGMGLKCRRGPVRFWWFIYVCDCYISNFHGGREDVIIGGFLKDTEVCQVMSKVGSNSILGVVHGRNELEAVDAELRFTRLITDMGFLQKDNVDVEILC